jgi:hypothetical protein
VLGRDYELGASVLSRSGLRDSGGHNGAMSSLCRRRHDGDHDSTTEFAHRCDGSVLG